MPESNNQFFVVLFGIVQALVVAAVVALGSYLFESNSRIAVLETTSKMQTSGINSNSVYIRQLDITISKLNTTLTLLNDRLRRDEKLNDEEAFR